MVTAVDEHRAMSDAPVGAQAVSACPDTLRVLDLRQRVRAAMEVDPIPAACPERLDERFMGEPLIMRKARATAVKLATLPDELWHGQLIAGSHSLESPRLHFEPRRPGGSGFPDYTTAQEAEEAAKDGKTILSIFGHIVPNYPRLLQRGLRGILAEVDAQRPLARSADESAFLDAVQISLQAVIDYAQRLAARCEGKQPPATRRCAPQSCGRWRLTCASRPPSRRRPCGRRYSRSGCCT